MYSIIPKPQNYKELNGKYYLSKNLKIICPSNFLKAKNFLDEFITNKDQTDKIEFIYDKNVKEEGYNLIVDKNGISIFASDENGAFYASVTLKTILLQCNIVNDKYCIQHLIINDYPKYKIRSGMLDSSRHFFDVATIKKLLYNFALLKINTFHWHLSDDQGYRIESTKFPKLNEIGSKRKYEFLGPSYSVDVPWLKKGGNEYFHYYKKAEIIDIVSYAKNLCINIIPEIDVPGHTLCFTASYKNLSCRKQDYDILCMNGVSKDILCAGQDETFYFLKELFKEVSDLFPYKYFHIGGDEARNGHKTWMKCPSCHKTMKENHIFTGIGLQSYFTNKIFAILKDLGKTPIQWNDGISLKTFNDLIGQYWTKNHISIFEINNKKRKYIISPEDYFYFDISYEYLSLKKCYNFKISDIGIKNNKNIYGMEFAIWSEWITDKKGLEFATYPRIFAASECFWTKDNLKDFSEFYQRLNFYKNYMNTKDINYSHIEGKIENIHNPKKYHCGSLGPEFAENEKLK